MERVKLKEPGITAVTSLTDSQGQVLAVSKENWLHVDLYLGFWNCFLIEMKISVFT